MAKQPDNPTRRSLLGAALAIPAILTIGGAAAFATARASAEGAATYQDAALQRVINLEKARLARREGNR